MSTINLAMKKSTAYQLKKEFEFYLNESDVAYGSHSETESIKFDDFFENRMLAISVIRKGIPFSLFEKIVDYSPFSELKWAEFLDISTKSFQRYKLVENFHFKPIHSEKILEILEVLQSGLDLFGSFDKLDLWLKTPNFALGNMPPQELLKDSYGKDLVLGEIHRINHGILV